MFYSRDALLLITVARLFAFRQAASKMFGRLMVAVDSGSWILRRGYVPNGGCIGVRPGCYALRGQARGAY
jgi:hypothetical protein